MKNGLQKSIENINGTLQPVKDWEDLLSLNSEEEFYNKDSYSIGGNNIINNDFVNNGGIKIKTDKIIYNKVAYIA